MAKLQNYPREYNMDRSIIKTAIFSKDNFLLYIVACFFAICGCRQPTASKPEALAALQHMQDLATVEFTVSKVIRANDNRDWYKWGDRKILFTCEAYLKAGINLSQLTEQDIDIDDHSIRIQLPPPTLLSVNMPPENIRMAYSEIGLFRSDFTTREKDALLAQAEKQIREAAPETGILDQAKLNTQTLLVQWLKQMGFEQIELTYDKESQVIERKG